jgi:hypothetical protein
MLNHTEVWQILGSKGKCPSRFITANLSLTKLGCVMPISGVGGHASSQSSMCFLNHAQQTIGFRKGVFERVWLNRDQVPGLQHHRRVPNLLNSAQKNNPNFIKSWGQSNLTQFSD